MVGSSETAAEVFFKKSVLKHPCWSLFLIELKLQQRRFPVNIAKLLRTHILMNICERLLLVVFYKYDTVYH